jgi:tetratricopeptide (TPR) repeat protein
VSFLLHSFAYVVLWLVVPLLPARLCLRDHLVVNAAASARRCIAGNCFSLQREHESAVRLFQRALQLAPHMAYAATLLGHEHLAGEDLAAAATAYQHALRCDPRHYNAL